MRAIHKTLLSMFAVGTITQGRAARAQPDQPATPPPPNQTNQTTQTTTGSYDDPARPDTVTSSPGKFSYAWSDRRLRSSIGISTILGGGITGFTDKTLRDTTSSVGGLWDLRVTIGSHIPIALEVGYLGSAMNLKRLPPGQGGTLVGTTAEAALRYNVLPHFAWTPYLFGGVGWQRYDVTQTDVMLATSGLNDHDNLIEFPMGAGLSYRKNGLVADVRGTLRLAADQNLVITTPSLSPTSGDFAPMHTWEASAAVGYEF